MLTRIVQMTFEPDKVGLFLNHFEQVKLEVSKFKGCQGLRLLQDQNNPCVIFTYSVWNSIEDLERYRHSALFQSIWPKIKPWFASKAQAWSLNETFNGFF